ncbi:MAG: hypothetical protein A3D92_01405 [Bacteroidetes bacterium RIFCSPHIGHO2_02_FULL_44_7]|nr:MAG: hypothetical protein A3D92_01405 [Bacteroidetes bacterium RIFCSPHIGHO2_02_FULL_44_7]
MKRIQLLLLALLFATFAFGQAPDYFKYQSIARNTTGTILANASVGLRISIRDLSAAGTVVFQETHAVTTNDFGLFTISIGAGTPSLGTISGVA